MSKVINNIMHNNEWMDWTIDTVDLTLEPILESAQEYQDWRLFLDMLDVSDPADPLILSALYPKWWPNRTQQDVTISKWYSALTSAVKLSCVARKSVEK